MARKKLKKLKPRKDDGKNATPAEVQPPATEKAAEEATTATAEAQAEPPESKESKPQANGDGATQDDALPDDKFYRKLIKLRKRVLEREAEEKEAHEEHKAAKAATELAAQDLMKWIDAHNGTSMPLYDRKKNGKPEGDKPAEQASTGDEAWRSTPIAGALEGVPDSVIEKLIAHDIHTMGDFSNFCEKNQRKVNSGEHPIKSIKGIGPAKIELIEAATDAFWKRVQQATSETAEAK